MRSDLCKGVRVAPGADAIMWAQSPSRVEWRVRGKYVPVKYDCALAPGPALRWDVGGVCNSGTARGRAGARLGVGNTMSDDDLRVAP